MFFLVQTYDPIIGVLNKFKIRRSVRPLALIQLYIWNWFILFLYLAILGDIFYNNALIMSHIFYLALLSYSATLSYHIVKETDKDGKTRWIVPLSDKGGYLLVAASAVLITGIVLSLLVNTQLGRTVDQKIRSALGKAYYLEGYIKSDTECYKLEIIKSDTAVVPIDVLRANESINIINYKNRPLLKVNETGKDKMVKMIQIIDKFGRILFIPDDKMTTKKPAGIKDWFTNLHKNISDLPGYTNKNTILYVLPLQKAEDSSNVIIEINGFFKFKDVPKNTQLYFPDYYEARKSGNGEIYIMVNIAGIEGYILQSDLYQGELPNNLRPESEMSSTDKMSEKSLLEENTLSNVIKEQTLFHDTPINRQYRILTASGKPFELESVSYGWQTYASGAEFIMRNSDPDIVKGIVPNEQFRVVH